MKLINIGNVWVLKADKYGSSDLLIDGVEFLKFSEDHQFSTKPEVITKIITKRGVDFYQNEAEETLSVEDYDAKIAQLRETATYDEDYGYSWDNLDDEYAHKKFVTEWKPVYKEWREFEPVEIEELKQRYSEFPDIIPMFQVGDIDDPICTYTPNISAYIREACKRHGLVEMEDNTWRDKTTENGFSIGNNWEYAKVLGNYIWLGDKPKFYGCRDTYDKCIERRQQIVQAVQSQIDNLYHKETAKYAMGTLQVKEMIENLQKIQGLTNKLSVHRNSDSKATHNALKNVIRESLKELGIK